jgi:hypothetical protein
MRHLAYGILAGLLFVTSAAAQPASHDNKAVSPRDPAKDGKAADQAGKPGQAAGDPAAPPASAPQEVKEDPMANFNVLGNAVGDGLGVPR